MVAVAVLACDGLRHGAERFVDLALELESLRQHLYVKRLLLVDARDDGAGRREAIVAGVTAILAVFVCDAGVGAVGLGLGLGLGLGGDSLTSASLANSAARSRARSEMSPSACDCSRQAIRLMSQGLLPAFVCSPNTSA